MAVETFPRSPQRSVLDHAFDLSRVNLEVVAYLVVVFLSVIAHLWGLGNMAMHHDEAIHAWTSWRFYTGSGDFLCANGGRSATYCYDPVYHGPSLYVFSLLSYFLFGDGDFQARLPMALAGIGMVASSWMLRPYLGRRGALIAAVLLGFSPSLLYFTRFARHDGLMVLWELWMIIGIFRFIDTGRARYLYLLAASLALAIATHELYYILFFIFGIFMLVRLIVELGFQKQLDRGLLILIGVGTVIVLLGRQVDLALPVGEGLHLGEKAFLVAAALLLAWLSMRVWDPRPVVIPRFKALWQEDRATLWIALGILGGIYLVLYTTFFAYPRGALDGLYAGLAYWLGSQHDFARGDQPWYYYLMQLPLYEPLGVLTGIGAAIYLFGRRRPRMTGEPAAGDTPRVTSEPAANNAPQMSDGDPAGPPDSADGGRPQNVKPWMRGDRIVTTVTASGTPRSAAAARTELPYAAVTQTLFPILLVFWYFNSIVLFSWAGEKMPWLLVHMSLPGNLVAAWVLGRLVRKIKWRELPDQRWALLVPPALLLLFTFLGVALWRFDPQAGGLAGQSSVLQGMVPLLLAGGLLFALLTLAQRLGLGIVLSLSGLTIAGVLGLYMIRATWMAVYRHPDTPIELLVYTQTAPDVPRYVEDIREIAINLTRNQRSDEDVAGGLTMPIIVDSGNAEGEGSLAWPLQWYLRDFQRLVWRNGSEFRDNPNLNSLEVEMPDGSTGLAPVVMLSKPHVTPEVREVLREAYVRPYGEGGVFNWWFPEGDKCSPQSAGYKKFYFNSWMRSEDYTQPGPKGCDRDISEELHAPWGPLTWPLNPQNRETLWNFVLYRDLPSPLQPGAREMEVWLRQDLVSGADEVTTATGSSVSSGNLRLLANQVIGGPEELSSPVGLATDRRGNVYVADTLNHRIQVFDVDGELIRSIGSQGSGEDQFYEPRGVTVDSAGNIYVADTWNARIVKLSSTGEWLATWGSGDETLDGRRFTDTGGTAEGNAENPLSFYGPRGVAVDAQGNVYIADTGNKRVVVTDDEGEYLYQFGSAGTEAGQFNEPTGVAVDRAGRIYVADTWNGRVQIFQSADDEREIALPIATWDVGGWQANTYEDPSIAVSPDGEIYVSVPLQNRVVAANLRGEVILRWGGRGEDLASLNSPSGVAVGPGGQVYVADRNSNRVLRFALPSLLPETETEGNE
jgi:uncharacterized protein (TIGR03663 family)